ncbi:induced myeloid leukemia cell differentiation protein Mcl-1 homolog [Montipora capricornis]|uniref:induced myeloid leukemia cell differentiation protein Mcl-1 homolog n=1 Tax=Montipora capricornis TaxID=246305 RepID=UPI0035F1EE82
MSISGFRKFIFSLSQELSADNLTSMKYLLRDSLTTREIEGINCATDLLVLLEQRNELGRNNCSLFKDLLSEIQRLDLVRKLEDFDRKQLTVNDRIEYDGIENLGYRSVNNADQNGNVTDGEHVSEESGRNDDCRSRDLREKTTSSTTMKNHMKDIHELVCDYIYYNKLGKEAYRADTKAAATLRQVGKEVESRYPSLLKTMCERLETNASKAEVAFRNVVDEVFSDGVNWGRIVAVVCFASELAVSSSQHGTDVVDNIVGWLSEYLSKGTVGEWIIKTGGWEAFVEHWKVPDTFWWLRTSITIDSASVGLGSLATLLYRDFVKR